MTEPRFKIRVFKRCQFSESKSFHEWFAYDPDLGEPECYRVVYTMLEKVREFEDGQMFDIEMRSLDDILLGETYLGDEQGSIIRNMKTPYGKFVPVSRIIRVLNAIAAENGAWMRYNDILPKRMYFERRYYLNRFGTPYFFLYNVTGKSNFSLTIRGYVNKLIDIVPYNIYNLNVFGVPVSFQWLPSCVSKNDVLANSVNSHRIALNLGREMDRA